MRRSDSSFWSLKNVDRKTIDFKISRDVDFINSPKHDNSLKEFLKQNPNGASDAVICKALCISQEEFDKLLNSAMIKMKATMGAKNE